MKSIIEVKNQIRQEPEYWQIPFMDFVDDFFLVPTRRRGNRFSTRQRRADRNGTLARPEWVPTPASGNQKTASKALCVFNAIKLRTDTQVCPYKTPRIL
jgi:hypothetical protein